MAKLVKLTSSQIIEINKVIGEGGTILNKANFEQMIDKLEYTEEMLSYATTLLHDIISLHAFLNGNKRTAFYAMVTFLELNNVKFKYDKSEIDVVGNYLNKIALGEVNRNQIQKWIKKMIE